MADRFPLIVDSVNNNIKELPSGDNLDLTGNNIVNVGNITTTGYIAGPASFTIDPAAVGDATGTLIILGNLQVEGTTTTINSTTIELDDKNIVLASGAANAAAADGAGITIDGASATLTYNSTPDAWSFNKNVGIGTSSPVDKLHISSSGLVTLRVESTDDSNAQIHLRNIGSTDQFITAQNGELLFEQGSNEAMRIDSSGNVGIGTSSPSYTLEVSGDAVATQGMPIATESGTSRTFALTDIGNYIRTTSASATTVTIPPNSSVAFPIGAEIIVFQAGAGTVTFAAGSGVTINSKDGALSLSAQYAAATCKKVATDTWDLIGDLA